MEYSNHLSIAKLGEQKAKEYLEKQGFTIIEQNWRNKRAEIDLVVQKKKVLAIVEVRSSVGEEFGTPEETIDWRKKRKLYGNAKAYVAYHKYTGFYRIDAVCVVFRGDGSDTPTRLTYYENIVTDYK